MADKQEKPQSEADRIAAMREEIADYERKTNEGAVKYADKMLKPVRDFLDSDELKATLETAEAARIASVQFPQLNSMVSSLHSTVDAIRGETDRAHQQAVADKIRESGVSIGPA